MYIKGKIFLTNICKTIKLIAIQDITEIKIHILSKSFDNKFRAYNKAGFKIKRIHVDTEFKPVEDTFKDIDIIMNYSTVQEHVTGIENAIRRIR